MVGGSPADLTVTPEAAALVNGALAISGNGPGAWPERPDLSHFGTSYLSPRCALTRNQNSIDHLFGVGGPTHHLATPPAPLAKSYFISA